MSEIQERVAQQASLGDEELPIAPDPNLKFWKDMAKGLLGESIKSIEGTVALASVAGQPVGRSARLLPPHLHQ